MKKATFIIHIFLTIFLLQLMVDLGHVQEYTKTATKNQSGQTDYEKIKNQTYTNKKAIQSKPNIHDKSNSSSIKDWFDIAQSIATIIALIIGGIWTYRLFYLKRQRQPRANLKHNISHLKINNNKIFLRVTVNITNTGDILLPLRYASTRILRVLPLSDDFKKKFRKGEVPLFEDSCEIDWPEIDLFRSDWGEGDFEIEPNESDHTHYDFILDATENQVILIYSYFKNVIKSESGLGWNSHTLYDLRN